MRVIIFADGCTKLINLFYSKLSDWIHIYHTWYKYHDFPKHQVPDYISETIWLRGVFMWHAYGWKITALQGYSEMGIIARPLGTTHAFCSDRFQLPWLSLESESNAERAIFLFFLLRLCGRKTFRTIRWRHLSDDLSFRRDFNLLAYVKTEQDWCLLHFV